MERPLPIRDSDVLKDARLFASRYHLIKSLSERLKGKRIAEVGIAFGDFTKFLLQELDPSHFDAYDIFKLTDSQRMNGVSCADILKGKTHLEFFNERFESAIKAGVLRAIPGDSSSNLKNAKVQYDMIYVDGDHSYPGVKRDADVAVNCLAEDGVLIFNDYTMMDLSGYKYGIVPVVNDLCVNHNWKIFAFAFQPDMFCDIALVRGSAAA
ncbi:hypothetical protein DK847_01430 [Aestuariivirga litoralis]|uniref:Class I SAM-dependent methyltransferase n=1 Tax=Aestuariivirga litoralis TaxID=2650924 RepID=A0A2W2AXL9_9HYPH|nr:class I SAM-dependent methyltransferase [Aestuariivirga litoralis]PZF78502.1 hypothetical protein DK847_01430 [Aestuariivirga litoralis]